MSDDPIPDYSFSKNQCCYYYHYWVFFFSFSFHFTTESLYCPRLTCWHACCFFLTLFPPFALLSVCNVEGVPVAPTRWQVWPCWPASWLLARPWSPTSSSPRRLKSDPWRSRATAWGPRWPGGGWAEEVFELKTVGTSLQQCLQQGQIWVKQP